jgi:hypothetical protein
MKERIDMSREREEGEFVEKKREANESIIRFERLGALIREVSERGMDAWKGRNGYKI